MLLRSSFSLVSRQRAEGRMTLSPPQSLAVGCRDSAFSIPPFGLQHSALILAVRTSSPGPHFGGTERGCAAAAGGGDAWSAVGIAQK
jgi:hypothetical protein